MAGGVGEELGERINGYTPCVEAVRTKRGMERVVMRLGAFLCGLELWPALGNDEDESGGCLHFVMNAEVETLLEEVLQQRLDLLVGERSFALDCGVDVVPLRMRTPLAIALLLTATILPAQNQTFTDHGKDKLRFTLVLSRHGIRPPLTAASALDLHSYDPWPEWEPLGYLTPH